MEWSKQSGYGYATHVITTPVDDVTLTFVQQNDVYAAMGQSSGLTTITLGDLITVSWSGVTYSCVVKSYTNGNRNYIYFGNGYIMFDLPDTGEPFLYMVQGGNEGWIKLTSGSETVTVVRDVPTYHKISRDYITIVPTIKIVQSQIITDDPPVATLTDEQVAIMEEYSIINYDVSAFGYGCFPYIKTSINSNTLSFTNPGSVSDATSLRNAIGLSINKDTNVCTMSWISNIFTVPSYPSAQGTYILKCVRTSSSTTTSWVAE